MDKIKKEKKKRIKKYFVNKIIHCKNGWIVYNTFLERFDVFKGHNTDFTELPEKDVIDIWKLIKEGKMEALLSEKESE